MVVDKESNIGSDHDEVCVKKIKIIWSRTIITQENFTPSILLFVVKFTIFMWKTRSEKNIENLLGTNITCQQLYQFIIFEQKQ